MLTEASLLNYLIKSEMNNRDSIPFVGFFQRSILANYETLSDHGIPFLHDFDFCNIPNSTEEDLKEIEINVQEFLESLDLTYLTWEDNYNMVIIKNSPIVEVW